MILWKERLADPAFWILLGNFVGGILLLFGIAPDTTNKIIGAIMSLGSLAIFAIQGTIVELARTRMEVARIEQDTAQLNNEAQIEVAQINKR